LGWWVFFWVDGPWRQEEKAGFLFAALREFIRGSGLRNEAVLRNNVILFATQLGTEAFNNNMFYTLVIQFILNKEKLLF